MYLYNTKKKKKESFNLQLYIIMCACMYIDIGYRFPIAYINTDWIGFEGGLNRLKRKIVSSRILHPIDGVWIAWFPLSEDDRHDRRRCQRRKISMRNMREGGEKGGSLEWREVRSEGGTSFRNDFNFVTLSRSRDERARLLQDMLTEKSDQDTLNFYLQNGRTQSCDTLCANCKTIKERFQRK